jgi:thioredoxin-like negative regulator of GroEL
MPPAAPPASAATVRGQPVRSPTSVPSAEQWKRAAEGLRDGDYQRADAALKQLTRSGTEADRESALLVQAQVLLAQGREREAQILLKSLEGSARAPSVRRKSVELLARLRDRPAPGSGKARVVTEPP